MRLIFALLAIFAATPLFAQETGLKTLQTGDDSRGWDAVGRINIGTRGFCTGTLIAPNLVLTAGHCLYDKETGAKVDTSTLEFLAGWRNGRAAAYRKVRRAIAHPDFIYGGTEKLGRVAHDLALLELDQPIRLPSIQPFETDTRPATGDEVGVVSYAKNREDAPSLQHVCHVLSKQPALLVLSCDVDFGSSGSPVFTMKGGVPRIVSVVSSKAEVEGNKVSLGTLLEAPLEELRAELTKDDGVFRKVMPTSGTLSGTQAGGAKFVRPSLP